MTLNTGNDVVKNSPLPKEKKKKQRNKINKRKRKRNQRKRKEKESVGHREVGASIIGNSDDGGRFNLLSFCSFVSYLR